MTELSILNKILETLPWNEIVSDLWQSFRFLISNFFDKGSYLVLEYSFKLKILDPYGKKARYSKQLFIKYRQNNICAIHEQAWGDGKIYLNFRCSPGKAVDQYRVGHKQLKLISLRQIRNRGEQDTIQIDWEMENSFLSSTEEWTTTISHHTKNLFIQIEFPKNKPPQKLWLVENNRKKQEELSLNNLKQKPNGSWKFEKKIHYPRLYEDYILRWQW